MKMVFDFGCISIKTSARNRKVSCQEKIWRNFKSPMFYVGSKTCLSFDISNKKCDLMQWTIRSIKKSSPKTVSAMRLSGKKIPVWNLFTVTHTIRLDCLIDVVDLRKPEDYTFSVNEDLIKIQNYFCSKSRTFEAKFSCSIIWELLRVPFGRISWPTGGYRRHTPRRPDTADCSSNAAGGHSYPTPPCGYPSFCADPAASRHRSSLWAPGTISASSLRGTHTSSSAGDTPRTFPAASPCPRRSGWSVAPRPVRSPSRGADPYPHPPEYTGGSAGTLSAPPPNQKTEKINTTYSMINTRLGDAEWAC